MSDQGRLGCGCAAVLLLAAVALGFLSWFVITDPLGVVFPDLGGRRSDLGIGITLAVLAGVCLLAAIAAPGAVRRWDNRDPGTGMEWVCRDCGLKIGHLGNACPRCGTQRADPVGDQRCPDCGQQAALTDRGRCLGCDARLGPSIPPA